MSETFDRESAMGKILREQSERDVFRPGTFDREAIRRGRAWAQFNATSYIPARNTAAFLAHYDAMEDALARAREEILSYAGVDGASNAHLHHYYVDYIDAVLEAYASQKEAGE